jgi:hypothetical protein
VEVDSKENLKEIVAKFRGNLTIKSRRIDIEES